MYENINKTHLNLDAKKTLDYIQKYFLYYTPHSKQDLFHSLNCRQKLFCGGNRTGKSICGAIEMAMHLTGIYPYHWSGTRFTKPINVWICGVSNDLLKNSLQKYYFGDPTSADVFLKNGAIPKSALINTTYRPGIPGAISDFSVRHVSGGVSTAQFKSYEQGREAFQGVKIHACHMDEESPFNIYGEIVQRLTSFDGSPSIMLITATPLYGMTSMLKRFLYDDDGVAITEGTIHNGRAFVQSTWEDNPYLSEEERKNLYANTPAHELEARSKGIPSLGSGMVYPISENLITVEPFKIPDYWPRFFALDFGWHDPTAAVFFAHDRDNDVVYAYAEYGKSQLLPEVHARTLIEMGADWIPCVYDPSGLQSSQKDGKRFADLYRDAGIRTMYKANNEKEKGVHTVLQHFSDGRLKIFKTLYKTLAEYRMYARYPEGDKKVGTIRDGNDHWMDCVRYGIMSGKSIAITRNELLYKNVQNSSSYW